MNRDDRTERFIRLMTGHQNGLFTYLASLLGSLNDAQDVLQETNLVLWRRSDDFVEGTDFGAWARTIAHYQILAYVRDKKRDRHVFDVQLLQQLAQRPQPGGDDEGRRLALRRCLAELPDDQRWLIGQRYSPGGSIKGIAQQLGKSEGAIKMTLSRIRQNLMHCIRGKLAAEG
jgi:RNA polymerase sigma-70 factor (ECF subfamily)